jgi:hypothetical protein
MSLRAKEQLSLVQNAPDITPIFDESEIEIAGTQTFGRLRALVAKGYEPDYEGSDDSCLLLTHPRKRFKYREMLLDSSGTVWWRYDQDYTTHFSRWEKKRFDTFLRHVPRPSWWDRTQAHRERIYAFVIGAVACCVLYILVSEAIILAYNFLGWN